MRTYRIIGLILLSALLAWQYLLPDTRIDTVFTTLTGTQTSLQSLRGKPVLVTFLATDCPNCIAEIPQLTRLYQQWHPQGLEMIAVNMYYDPPSHVVSMVQSRQLPYPVALDTTGQHAHAFGDVQLIPATFLIAPDGSIGQHMIGPINTGKLESQITRYLNTKG